MKAYLNAKLILFRQILKKGSSIISDKRIKPFPLIKKIAKNKNFKLLDIDNEFTKIKNIYLKTSNDYKIEKYIYGS